MLYKISFVALLSMAVVFCASAKLPFEYQVNQYNDVEVTIPQCETPQDFEQRMLDSIAHWISKGNKSVWLALPVENSVYLPILIKHHFTIHHASAEKIVLSLWLKPGEKNILPRFTTHIVGVACLVIDKDNNVLMVKERWGTERHNQCRLPGGGMEPYEDVATAAVREVKEETGIDTEFQAIVALRDGGNWPYCMDVVSKFYVCCLLRPLTHDITMQESEIVDARWMPLDEFKRQAKGVFSEFVSLYLAGGPFIELAYSDSKKGTLMYH